ncbi:Dephospho-CoA kinase [compost metagenome]
MCDRNVLVVAPLEVRLQRVMQRDGVTEEQVRARMDKQLSDEEKAKMADMVVRNNETDSLIVQVMELHHQFLNILP